MKKTKLLLASAAVSCLPAFSAMAEGNDILNNMSEGASLALYQYDATQGFCDNFNMNVIPLLDKLDLERAVTANFDDRDVDCLVRVGGNLTYIASGSRLALGDKFDDAEVAQNVLEVMSRNDLIKVRDALPGLNMK